MVQGHAVHGICIFKMITRARFSFISSETDKLGWDTLEQCILFYQLQMNIFRQDIDGIKFPPKLDLYCSSLDYLTPFSPPYLQNTVD